MNAYYYVTIENKSPFPLGLWYQKYRGQKLKVRGSKYYQDTGLIHLSKLDPNWPRDASGKLFKGLEGTLTIDIRHIDETGPVYVDQYGPDI